jgi:hypothetical protein
MATHSDNRESYINMFPQTGSHYDKSLVKSHEQACDYHLVIVGGHLAMPCDNLNVAQSTVNIFNKLKPRRSHFNSLLKENDTTTARRVMSLVSHNEPLQNVTLQIK